jgi:prepilin-type processing-associated H-X9-DG protein
MREAEIFPDGYVVPKANPGFGNNCLKRQSNCKKASENLVLTDSDNYQSAFGINSINNWPDVANNHGAQGWNMAYLDGHVAFTLTGKAILEGFMGGHYITSIPGGGRDENQFINKYGLFHVNNKYEWR